MVRRDGHVLKKRCGFHLYRMPTTTHLPLSSMGLFSFDEEAFHSHTIKNDNLDVAKLKTNQSTSSIS